MLHLIIAAALIGVLYVVLVETLFKKSKCKGTADVTGKTAIITGENLNQLYLKVNITTHLFRCACVCHADFSNVLLTKLKNR